MSSRWNHIAAHFSWCNSSRRSKTAVTRMSCTQRFAVKSNARPKFLLHLTFFQEFFTLSGWILCGTVATERSLLVLTPPCQVTVEYFCDGTRGYTTINIGVMKSFLGITEKDIKSCDTSLFWPIEEEERNPISVVPVHYDAHMSIFGAIQISHSWERSGIVLRHVGMRHPPHRQCLSGSPNRKS